METLTQNHLSPPPRQQAERPVLICARCESTIKREIMITSIPDRDVCETFKQRNEVISSLISVFLSANVGAFSQVPAGIRSGPAEPGG